jgi:hypothetical protein
MAKLSNEFKEVVKETAITIVINACGVILKSLGESLVNTQKFDKPRVQQTKDGAIIDNSKVQPGDANTIA